MSGRQKGAPEKSVRDFLLRWSRRKLGIAGAEAGADVAAAGEPQPPPAGGSEPVDPAPHAAAPLESAAAAFDPKNLPPIESIGAATDIRPFLAPGVPVELTRAALRRAWTSDPTIRDFIGIAENQWDFTNPDSVPGFGALEFTDEIRGMVSRLFGETPVAEAQNSAHSADRAEESISAAPAQEKINAAQSDAPAAVVAAAADTAGAATGLSRDPIGPHVAPQNDPPIAEPALAQRKHGGALPK